MALNVGNADSTRSSTIGIPGAKNAPIMAMMAMSHTMIMAR